MNSEIFKLTPLEGQNRLGLIKLETEDGIYIGEGDYVTPMGGGVIHLKIVNKYGLVILKMVKKVNTVNFMIKEN